MKYFLILTIILKFNFGVAATNLDLNDVSILMPLPPVNQWSQLLDGTRAGPKGPLLPLSYLKSLPQILGLATNEQIYPILHVVALRIDPCFSEGFTPSGCRPQIRMIWQPLAENDDTTTTFDASLHSFYELSRAEFGSLVQELSQLKAAQTSTIESQALSINPYLKLNGLESPFAKKLFEIVLNHAGESNLSRITFMQLFLNGNIWQFGGVDISHQKDGQTRLSEIKIPGTDVTLQQFRNNAKPNPTYFSGGPSPIPNLNAEFSFLLFDSRAISLPQSEKEISDAVRAAYRIENPNLNNPGTVDCVSCHTAQAAKVWALTHFESLNLPAKNTDVIFNSDRNLNNISPSQDQTNNLRAFGYFLDQPISSQRTINESAEVVRQINLLF